jgi:hypothetical protein
MKPNEENQTVSQPANASNGDGSIQFPKQEANDGLTPEERRQYEAVKNTPAGIAARAEWENQQRQMRFHSMNLDFAFYMAILFLNEYCKQEGPEAGTVKAGLTIQSWRNRVLNSCQGNPQMLALIGPDLDQYCEMLKKVSGIPFEFSAKPAMGHAVNTGTITPDKN